MKLLQLIILVWLFYRLAKWLSDDNSSSIEEQRKRQQKRVFPGKDDSIYQPDISRNAIRETDSSNDIAYLSNDVEIHQPLSLYYRYILRLQNIPDINIEIIEIAGRIKHKEYREFNSPTQVDNYIDAAIHYLGDEWKYRSYPN